MDWGRSSRIYGTLKGSWGLRRLIEAITVGSILMVTYLIFAFTGKPSGIAYVQSENGCRFSSVSATFGRVPPPNGRYSDGRLIIDFIAEKLGFPHLRSYLDSIGANFHHEANFAASGSTIQHLDSQLYSAGFNPLTLDLQILQFEQLKARTFEFYAQAESSDIKMSLPNPESFERALFTLDSGQNDLHAGLTSMKVEQVKAMIPRIIEQFSVALENLYRLGARAFWIHNTGPIGCLPFFAAEHSLKRSYVDSVSCIKSYNEVAQEFNNQLKDRISKLRGQLRDAMLVYCGEKKKNTNGTELIGDSCSNPLEYICWDNVHYTEAANKWVASHILNGSFSEPRVSIAEACYNPS
ncbi:hypothetical protein ACJIZ3_013680 [Penstemon smallii]|uniref:Uncharacterized protein n=1 Tax=Penstemon smallii TaxID=265156 RepID=A0ABD3RHA2_9LAMI